MKDGQTRSAMTADTVPMTPIPKSAAGWSAQGLFWLAILAASMAWGLLYSAIFHPARPLAAMVYAGVTGLLVVAFERGVVLKSFHLRLRRLPTLIYVPLAELAYVLLIGIGNFIGGAIAWSLGLVPARLIDAVVLTPTVLVYALCASATIVFVVRVRDLIGAEAFGSLLIGRYHRPVEEERIFLFVDVVGSSAYAEAFGDLRAQQYLGEFFAALAAPVRRNGGSVDDYVGDMALITWPIVRGLADARCVSCIFDITEAIAQEAPAWQSRFGQVPAFRAALHGGSVITAEIGIDRHKISYFGDCVNMTARIETLCRSLDAPVLISADLVHRLPGLPPGVCLRAMGEHVVKGRDRGLSVYALEPHGA